MKGIIQRTKEEAEILLIQKEIDVLSLAKETIINKYMNQPI